MKTKPLAPTMKAALQRMFDYEGDAHVVGGFIKSNTATALEKRGLALRVCVFDNTEFYLLLTDEGREVARSLQAHQETEA